MISQKNENNIARMRGKVIENLKFSHSNCGEKFYETKIGIKRNSGVIDIIPIIVSERLSNACLVRANEQIEIFGEFRSYNTPNRELKLFIFVKQINILEEEIYKNEITLTGYICKPPIYRETPLGSQLTDVLLAVNRIIKYKSDYLPIIFWGVNAEYTSGFQVGEKIELSGRMQSRQYFKRLPDGTGVEKVAYELSAYILTKC